MTVLVYAQVSRKPDRSAPSRHSKVTRNLKSTACSGDRVSASIRGLKHPGKHTPVSGDTSTSMASDKAAVAGQLPHASSLIHGAAVQSNRNMSMPNTSSSVPAPAHVSGFVGPVGSKARFQQMRSNADHDVRHRRAGSPVSWTAPHPGLQTPGLARGKPSSRATLADAEISPARPGKARKFLLERLRTHLQAAAAAAAEAWAEGLAQFEEHDGGAAVLERSGDASGRPRASPFKPAVSSTGRAEADNMQHPFPDAVAAIGASGRNRSTMPVLQATSGLVQAGAGLDQSWKGSSVGRAALPGPGQRDDEAVAAMSLAKKLWVAEHVLSVESEWQRCACSDQL